MLEVLVKGACTQKHRIPLLFAHGAYHAAWLVLTQDAVAYDA
jgi:hypothetical protein